MEKEIYDPLKDSTYSKPFIDCQEMRERQLVDGSTTEYLYIHGGFEDTGVKFMFCFPTKEKYQGRFFQHLSPFPGPDEEIAAIYKRGEEDLIGFSISHGACYVESNMGSTAVFGSTEDSRIFYRSSAAVAEFCRKTAQDLFGEHRVYGYVFGGSGGGYKTMSCIENTASFDGALPFVIGSPVSLPNCLTSCVLAKRLLRHCLKNITEALEPGGSGDIYAGLNEEETAALKEIICLGFPPKMLACLAGDDDGSLPVLLPVVKQLDPDYFHEFWTVEGYEGADLSSAARRDRIYLRTKLISAGFLTNGDKVQGHDDRNGTDTAWQKMMTDASGSYLETEAVPTGDLFLHGVDIIFESGKAKGRKLHLQAIEGNMLIPGPGYGADDYKEIIGLLESGDKILLDNSDYVAVQYYHRHQVPEDLSFHAFDQYRGEDGKPIPKQRPMVISYGFTAGGCGSVQDGKIQGKVIIMNNLMDGDFPWQADWYKNKIEEVYGKEAAHDLVRVYYNDNAPHGDVNEGGDMTRVISYLGMLSQGLLVLSDWVEGRKEAPESTGYDLIDNQIILKEEAAERGGLQPKFDLYANGKKAIKAAAGTEVTFTATAESLASAGEYEELQWSLEGTPEFETVEADVELFKEGEVSKAIVKLSHTYTAPGTYYCVARIITNCNEGDGYTRLRNLDRVRIEVE